MKEFYPITPRALNSWHNSLWNSLTRGNIVSQEFANAVILCERELND